MKCTDCGVTIRPVVALDLDGTLGNYHLHFVEFAEGYVGHPLPRMWEGKPADWEEYLGLDRATYREIKLAFRQGGMKRTMPVYPGAADLANFVGGRAEVWITTTRPYNRLDSVDPDTREWLHRNHIWYDHLLYDDDKYGRLAELVDPARVVAVLDDLPEQCDRAIELFGVGSVLMRYNTHNRYDQHNGVASLFSAASKIEQYIEEWEKRNG